MSALRKLKYEYSENDNKKLNVAERKVFNEEPKRPVSRNTHRRSPLIDMVTLILIVVIFALLTFLVMRYANISETKYEIFQSKTEISELENKMVVLRGKIDNSVALEYVERVAVEELGMQYPTLQQSVYITANSCYVLDEKGETAGLQPKKEMRETVVENIESIGSKVGAYLNNLN